MTKLKLRGRLVSIFQEIKTFSIKFFIFYFLSSFWRDQIINNSMIWYSKNTSNVWKIEMLNPFTTSKIFTNLSFWVKVRILSSNYIFFQYIKTCLLITKYKRKRKVNIIYIWMKLGLEGWGAKLHYKF